MWLIISVLGYFLNSLAILIDRALLSKSIPHPAAYTFYITALGMIAIVLVPFGVVIPPPAIIAYSLGAGVFFAGALFTMFSALKDGEATQISPLIGGIQPLFVFILSAIFLQEVLVRNQLLGFVFILIGGLLIAAHKPSGGRKVYIYALASTILFASSYVMLKYVFDAVDVFGSENSAFVNGFFWSRFGAFLSASVLLFSPLLRSQIFPKKQPGPKQKTGLVFLFGQICGASSFILVTYAISLSSVTLINSMQGLQFAFLFIMVYPLSKKFPQYWPETWTTKILLNKVVSIILIAVGLYFIAT